MSGGNFANIMRASLLSLRDTGTTVTRGLINSFSSFFNSLKNGFADSVAHSIVYATSLGDALRDVARSAVAELLSALIKLGIQWVINHTIGTSLAAASTTAVVAQMATIGAAAAAPAALVSIASFGAADAAGAAGLAATVGLAKALSIAKFADGGLVSGPGGPRDDKITARLSDGEFVVNAEATRKNRKLLEAINGGMGVANDNHFANGGFVRGGGGGQNVVFNLQGANFGGSNPEEIEKRFRKVMQEEYAPAILQEADKNTQKRMVTVGRQRLNGARM